MRWLAADEVWSLYGQGRYWIDRHGTKHRLATMELSYLRNLVGFIQEYGPSHLLAASLAPYPQVNGDMARYMVERAIDAQTEDMIGWAGDIESSPLMRGLRSELSRRFPTKEEE